MTQIDGDHYYCLINLRGEGALEKPIHFNEKQIEAFRKIVKVIIEQPEGIMDETKLLGQTKLKSRETQALIDDLVRNHWLSRVEPTDDDNDQQEGIVVGIRTMLELRSWLEEQTTLSECAVCKKMVIYCSLCDSCDCKIHKHCERLFFSEQSDADKVCPSCSSLWNRPIGKKRVRATTTTTTTNQSGSSSDVDSSDVDDDVLDSLKSKDTLLSSSSDDDHNDDSKKTTTTTSKNTASNDDTITQSSDNDNITQSSDDDSRGSKRSQSTRATRSSGRVKRQRVL